MKSILPVISAIILTACTNISTTSTADVSPEQQAQNTRLNNSPRHHEWVDVQNGERVVHTWVVYPERSDKAPAVLVIHENRGLNDWARSLADQIAEAGYIAVAPDFCLGIANSTTVQVTLRTTMPLEMLCIS